MKRQRTQLSLTHPTEPPTWNTYNSKSVEHKQFIVQVAYSSNRSPTQFNQYSLEFSIKSTYRSRCSQPQEKMECKIMQMKCQIIW